MSFDKRKMDGFVRVLTLLAVIVALGVCVSGCMGRDAGGVNERGVNDGRITQPSPSPDYMPRGTAVGVTDGSSAAAPFDWTRNAADVEGRIAQISEISEARVVVEGDTALVAVKFNSAYQGEMTERIREMVAAEVKKADPSIQTVAVTAVEEDVTRVYGLSDRMRAGNPLEAMAAEINEIVRNATTLR